MPTLIKCPHCANTLEWDAGMPSQLVACPFCGQHFTTPPTYPLVTPQAAPMMHQGPPIIVVQSQPTSSHLAYVPDKKSPGVAVLLSFFYTGLGQIYNGEVFKGLLMMLVLPFVLIFAFAFST